MWIAKASGTAYTSRMRFWILIMIMFASQAAPGGELEDRLTARVQAGNPARILFVGNSYSFQVPKAFAAVATAEGSRIVVEQVTKGGWTLAKHAASEATLDKIRGGRWDVVVLQEQSQMPATPEAQRQRVMIPAAKLLVDEIRKSGAIPVMFVTWGRRDGDKQNAKVFPNDTMESMQKRLNTGYREAAESSGGVALIPVGPTWLAAKKAGELDRLFAKDGSHPAKDGVYLSACVFYTTFYATEVKKAPPAQADLAKIAGSRD